MSKDRAATVVLADGGYMVGYADRDVSGYTPTTYVFESRWDAKRCADAINEAWGLSQEDALDIICSSMR